MKLACVYEHNGSDTLLFARDFPGAYSRGETLSLAMEKMRREMVSYFRWSGDICPDELEFEIVQDVASGLNIADADSDVLLEGENASLTGEEYRRLKQAVLRSAEDFLRLYTAVPDKNRQLGPDRHTFYGHVPNTAEQMYVHTKNVNAYYWGEIGINCNNEDSILVCREKGFEALEKKEDFLENKVAEGSYGEFWSLRKVCRRFIWHDRIHGKALYRRATQVFGTECIPNVFCFDLS